MNNLPNLATNRPTYPLIIPTTDESTTYQSYTKNEEKAILIASQEKDYPTLITTLNNILESHCTTELKTIVDFTYVLTHVRAKSHGEKHTFSLKKCECGKENITIKVDNILDHIKIKNKDNLKDIYNITDKISLRLCPTKIDMLKAIKFDDTADNAMIQVNNMIAYSVDYVINDKTIIKDFTKEQLIENIIKHLTPFQVEEINEKIGNLINICFEVKYLCSGCEKEYTKEINDFL